MDYYPFMNMERQDKCMEKYKQLAKICQSADKIGANECQKCGFCCWVRPCQLVKDDIRKISEFLKITPQELFKKYLIVDEIKLKLYVLPIRKEQQDVAGTYLPDVRTFDISTPCIFLDENNMCKIHEVKPLGGQMHRCWENVLHPKYHWRKSDIMQLLRWCNKL